MKISQVCAVALLMAVGSVMAFADGINDPKIVIHGVNGGNVAQDCRQGCINVGDNFNFDVPKGGSGTLFFTNTSGHAWTSLTLIETGEPASAISCVQSLFLSCTTKTMKNGSVEILLSGVNSGPHQAQNARTGIANGQSFDISFVCVSKSCWPGGLQFSGHANASVPEPGTVALMVTGFGAMLSRRKQWMKRLKA
jgi:hypothetical protein